MRALLRRSTGHAQSELTCGPVSLDTRTGRVSVSGNPIKMTSHEYRLLAYLMHHTGRVVSRTELVEHLYDQDFDRDFNTIEVFVGRIRKKLEVDIIQTVRGLGYLLTRRRRIPAWHPMILAANSLTNGRFSFDQAAVLLSCSRMILSANRHPSIGPSPPPPTCFPGSCSDARQFARHPAVPVRDRVGGGDPGHHRHRAVVGLSRRHRARLRPPSQPLSAHPDRRSRDPGRAARPPVPVARRAAVRTAAVRLVLADHPDRHRKGRDPRVALAVGQEAAEAGRTRHRPDRGRHPPRLCRRPGRPDAADGGTAGRSWRRRQIPGQRRRRRHRDFRRNPQLRLLPRRHLCRAHHRAAADHDFPGPVRAGAAEAHFGFDRRYPLRPRRTAGR